ncbi:M23 family peptidase [Peterkaempfera bronchialis]|uniref:M23 family peptidase n=1 Tax=Peterkaempfera bronchialis TaxID=2126346 RepID=A0A345SW59_9ACTN|nr:M23 family peptidase [Peterkaempfera bronchialis]
MHCVFTPPQADPADPVRPVAPQPSHPTPAGHPVWLERLSPVRLRGYSRRCSPAVEAKVEPVAYEGQGAGAVFPPPAAPDQSYAEYTDYAEPTEYARPTEYTGYTGTTYDTTGAWYGYGGVTAEQTGTWTTAATTTAEGWQQDPYATAYGYGTAETSWSADPSADVSWGTATLTSPDATGAYTTPDLYGAVGYDGYPQDTAVQGYGTYTEYGTTQDSAAQDFAGQDSAAQDFAGQDGQDGFAYDEYPYEDEYDEAPHDGTAAPEPAAAAAAVQATQTTQTTQAMQAAAPPVGGRAAARAARSKPRTARRSALLTIAVPSVAVMGVAAAAAVTVSIPDQGSSHDSAAGTPEATPSPKAAVALSSKLDTQLAGLRKNADDFAGRVSRNQARIDLKKRQEDEKKRKEALRPKFVLPVAEHGLSATFGMAGTHWAALHTGIDFPVSWGTDVRAATDGTVRTQWNSAYGYMAIVTASDGTETWYCHLSSYRIRSGKVKAGDTIAYSGSSGNSTGPHMHFEVHPGDGAPAVDPIPWLLSHGLNPR